MQILQEQISVHTDRDAVVEQHAGKGVAGELRALVGIENGRCATQRDGLFQTVHVKPCIQGVRQSPRQYFPAAPVDDRDPINKSAG